MARQGLKINGVTKYLDDGAVETLGTVNGLNLKHYGAFLFVDGNGNNTAAGSVAISKLCPPAAQTQAIMYRKNAYGCGVVPVCLTFDSLKFYSAMGGISVSAANETATTTGAGTFTTYDQTTFDGARPFMVALLGDSTTANTVGLKINGTTKSNLVLSADDNTGSLFRQAERADGTRGSGIQGSITASKWGNCVVVNITDMRGTFTAGTVLATLPTGFRPPQNTFIQLLNNSTFIPAYINTAGQIICQYSLDTTTQTGVYGCAVFGTSNTSGSALFNTVGLKLNGVTKNILQLNNTGLTAECATVTSGVSSVTGTCYLWKWGKFVVGNAYYTQTTASYANAFTLPTGFRPAAAATTSGFGFNGMTGKTGAVRNASIIDISTAGVVRIEGLSTGQAGLSFYFIAA
jgi:hypothetical protein